MNLFEVITQEIENDDECIEKKEEQLLDLYHNANTQEQTILNEVFIAMTGWSFETLVEMAKAN